MARVLYTVVLLSLCPWPINNPSVAFPVLDCSCSSNNYLRFMRRLTPALGTFTEVCPHSPVPCAISPIRLALTMYGTPYLGVQSVPYIQFCFESFSGIPCLATGNIPCALCVCILPSAAHEPGNHSTITEALSDYWPD